jgi:hypothetical protein
VLIGTPRFEDGRISRAGANAAGLSEKMVTEEIELDTKRRAGTQVERGIASLPFFS